MDNIILDLGSDVNDLMKQTWEMIGKSKLMWSPIHLRLTNQHKIVPIERLLGGNVNIDGVFSIADFEVIKIKYGSKPYLSLLGLDCDFDNKNLINLKKRHMVHSVGRVLVLAHQIKKKH
jgi:hypothetical protein